ncbi:MAG TPA: zf-HC2 domain-containing protein [Streptosporangiaceae bacterium]|nr:zf-HC2 domain-containing protein [Streptosporangiaceae bacterium]
MSHLGRRLSALIDGELSHTQRERALAHLAGCEDCRCEAAAMRALKHRMRTLGEATAAAALTDRLVAMSAGAQFAGVPSADFARQSRHLSAAARRRRTGRLAVGGLALLAVAVPAVGFLAGNEPRQPGPSVSPAVDLFVDQHAVAPDTGAAHQPVGVAGPSAGYPVRLAATTAPMPPASVRMLERLGG